jgi:hypothetical protein
MVFGMLPIALASGTASEWKNGLAWVIIGGLLSSLILTVYLVPLVYYTVDRIKGWNNQVPNDIILNYNISIEKQILQASKQILLIGIIETFSGTIYNAAGAGFMLRVGKFNDYFGNIYRPLTTERNKLQLYVFMKPIVRVVLSNALLQGGLLNQLRSQDTGYVLSKDQIERVVVLYDVGITFEMPKYRVIISQKSIGAEFKGQYDQEYGSLALQVKL